MNIYILVWSFFISEPQATYVEVTNTFKTMEECTVKMHEMSEFMDNAHGQCIITKVSR